MRSIGERVCIYVYNIRMCVYVGMWVCMRMRMCTYRRGESGGQGLDHDEVEGPPLRQRRVEKLVNTHTHGPHRLVHTHTGGHSGVREQLEGF